MSLLDALCKLVVFVDGRVGCDRVCRRLPACEAPEVKRPSTARALFSLGSATAAVAFFSLLVRQLLDSSGVENAFTLGAVVSGVVQLLLAVALYAGSCAASLLALAQKEKP